MSNPSTPQPGQQPPYGQPPYGQPPYGQPPYGTGYPPPPPPQKKGLQAWQWILMSIGGLIIVCCGLGILGTALAGHGTTTSTNTGSNTGNTTGSSSISQGPAKVGSTITADDVSCTLVSVKVIQGDDYIKPKPGNEFIVVHVKIVNKSNSEFDYNPFDFHVKSGAGNITDEEIIPPSTYTANDELHAGTLAAGGSVEGDIIFQAPTGDHKAQLTWQPSIFSDKTSNAWNLGL